MTSNDRRIILADFHGLFWARAVMADLRRRGYIETETWWERLDTINRAVAS